MAQQIPGRLLPVCLVMALVIAGCTEPGQEADEPAPPAPADEELVAFFQDLREDRHAVFETDHGAIRIHLYESLMPVTTARFIELVESGFYDGTQVHRNVERFVIQGGDPTGTGAGGSLQNIPHERHEDLLFGYGALGLARGLDEDSGDSQWFITLTPQPHLADPESSTAEVFGLYSLYGQVVAGMDAVRSMNQVPTIPGLDRPVEPPVVESVRIEENPGTDPQDLLVLPRTISDRVSIGGFQVDVDRPLHLFSGHPFEAGVYLRGDNGGSPPGQVKIHYQANVTTAAGETVVYEESYDLDPVDGDPLSFQGTVMLPRAGTWQETVRIGSEAGWTDRVEVHKWHEAYLGADGD